MISNEEVRAAVQRMRRVVFTVFPGTTKAVDPVSGRRYLNSQEIIGSIPDMLLETLALVQQRMQTGAVMKDGLRIDCPDYPIAAVLEAVANALQHRGDYSPEGRGTHVQVNLYADRIEILNPGGLYGATTVESLGREGLSSTRNEYLSRVLTYTPFEDGFIVENKGTGFMTIADELSRSGMVPVKVVSLPTFFSLTMFKKGVGAKAEPSFERKSLDEFILSELDRNGSICMKDIICQSGFSRGAVALHLKKLVEEGQVEPTERARSPRQRYRRVSGRKPDAQE